MSPGRTATSVMDASTLLAFVFKEPGWDAVRALAGDAPAMSAVNWSEVCQKASVYSVAPETLYDRALAIGLSVLDLTRSRSQSAAALWQETRFLGLSLADRVCLALAIELALPAVTADRAWARLAVPGLSVRPFR